MSYGMAYGANQDKEKEASKTVLQTKREINKEKRLRNQANRKVDRKYRPEDISDPASRAAAYAKERSGMDERRQRGKQFFVDLARAAAGSGDSNPYEVKPRTSRNGKEFVEKFKEDINPITTDNSLEQKQKKNNSIKNQLTLDENTEQTDPNVNYTYKENKGDGGIYIPGPGGFFKI